MRCPRTGAAMKQVTIGGIEVDVSEECGGVFFDHYELEKFDDATEIRGDVLIEHLRQFPPPLLDDSKPINCPRCVDYPMRRFHYNAAAQLELDECLNCGGIWFDAGELERLREVFSTTEARHQASREMEMGFAADPADRTSKPEPVNKGGRIANLLWRLLG